MFARSNQGMTLVEVLVAVLVLGLTLGVGIRAIGGNRRVEASTRQQAEALHAARAAMEQLNQLSFHHASLAVGTHALPDGGSYAVSLVPPGNPLSGLKQVVVQMPWPGGAPGAATQPSVSLTSVVSEALHP
jgi:prepilin-type N-terminal cleavage/methylation domain-containing protein